MNRPKYHTYACRTVALVSALFLLNPLTSKAQRLDAIGKEKPIKVTGGIGLEQVGYLSSGLQEGRREPYNFFLTGNINFDLFGWAVPFSFSYTNQGRVAFSQPFNQYGLTPTYKWITGHIGYTSMNFSSYTLSGHLFNGIGVDLAPAGRFKFSAMYGRLQQAVAPDTSRTEIIPAYKRMGYGFKASYGTGKDNIDLILFRGKDDPNSLTALSPQYNVTPQENLVLGVNVSKQLLSRLTVNAEVAWSALTRDARLESDTANQVKFPSLGLIQKNSTTALYTAYKAVMTYSANKYSLGMGYEWVAPEYKTLGAYYFTNDFENITGNLQFRLLKDKVTGGLNAGVQHNNLKKDKQSTMSRWVGALNLSWVASQKMNINCSYSNFQSFVNIKSDFDYINQVSPYQNLDTLNYTQISSNASVSMNYSISRTKEKAQMLMCNVSFMKSSDLQGGVKQPTGTVFYNLNTAYSMQLIPKNMSFTLGFNANRNSAMNIQSMTLGPTLGVNKTLLNKKLRTSGTVSWNGNFSNGSSGVKVMTARVSGAYTVKKKHNLNLGITGLNRSGSSTSAKSISELTSTLGYNYNF
ncbi:hypothetical protein SAMN05444266_102240 [Chitinophaga jiangningensis]|uniref:Outer membrane protein beta-barrel family protein n=1 Tax=Chitinophaga jiangningensis TaxID=1419482 RepID=A0A1M6YBH1_9BACT|nr:hypothetical protein [Chitinophaga jiangningensis]SHL15580.1 hypothetical protein SAMN05444266_102240 [Chitinophaga jiangningensis]